MSDVRPHPEVQQAIARAQQALQRGDAVAAELALLWEAARDFTRATDCFLLGAQNAVRLFANQEAVGLARHGLALLASLPIVPSVTARNSPSISPWDRP